MENSNYLEDIFESKPDERKIVLIIFPIQNDKNLLREKRFSKNDINLLNLKLENFLIEGHEE